MMWKAGASLPTVVRRWRIFVTSRKLPGPDAVLIDCSG